MQHLRTLTKLLAVVGLSVAAACYPETTVEQTWTSPTAMREQPFKRVVTVMFSENETARRAAEDQLARELLAKGVRASPSYAVLGEQEMPDSEAVRSKLLGMGFDGVVMMRLVDQHQELEYSPSTFSGYWSYGYPYFYSPGFYSPGYAYTETISRVETKAYSLRSGQLVWSALTKTVTDEEDTKQLIDQTTDVIATQLTRRGLAG
ncbi:MAG TPA: hypothetical protein VM513_10300 [Kofleriaceae bacterium]|jgi:hypothetical protein|nr:hypothetical protein [Kofleriaceae bacterium]